MQEQPGRRPCQHKDSRRNQDGGRTWRQSSPHLGREQPHELPSAKTDSGNGLADDEVALVQTSTLVNHPLEKQRSEHGDRNKHNLVMLGNWREARDGSVPTPRPDYLEGFSARGRFGCSGSPPSGLPPKTFGFSGCRSELKTLWGMFMPDTEYCAYVYAGFRYAVCRPRRLGYLSIPRPSPPVPRSPHFPTSTA